MGSVSTRLIRGAKVPVLVVPPSDGWELDATFHPLHSPPRDRGGWNRDRTARCRAFTFSFARGKCSYASTEPEWSSRALYTR